MYTYKRYKKASPTDNTPRPDRKYSPDHKVPPAKDIVNDMPLEERIQKELEDDLRVIEAINRLKKNNTKDNVVLPL